VTLSIFDLDDFQSNLHRAEVFPMDSQALVRYIALVQLKERAVGIIVINQLGEAHSSLRILALRTWTKPPL